MKTLKALRTNTVNKTLKTSFGITLGTQDLRAKCVGILNLDNDYMMYGYEVYYPSKTVIVTVTTRNEQVVSSSNSIDPTIIEKLKKSEIESEVFSVAHGDWAYIHPKLDHEDIEVMN